MSPRPVRLRFALCCTPAPRAGPAIGTRAKRMHRYLPGDANHAPPRPRAARQSCRTSVRAPVRRVAIPGDDPLDGTIAEYQAGRRRGAWSAVEVTTRRWSVAARMARDGDAIDVLSSTALVEARAADSRLRAGRVLGPLDGVPVFAKAIYDMQGVSDHRLERGVGTTLSRRAASRRTGGRAPARGRRNRSRKDSRR